MAVSLARAPPAGSAHELGEFLNKTRYDDLPLLTVEHAKMIIASTLASAAPGSRIGSARNLRDLAKEHVEAGGDQLFRQGEERGGADTSAQPDALTSAPINPQARDLPR